MRKGYLKIHFAVDVKTGQVVSMDFGEGRGWEEAEEAGEEGGGERQGEEGPCRRRLRLEGQLQVPRRGGNQASHQGGEELPPHKTVVLPEEDG